MQSVGHAGTRQLQKFLLAANGAPSGGDCSVAASHGSSEDHRNRLPNSYSKKNRRRSKNPTATGVVTDSDGRWWRLWRRTG